MGICVVCLAVYTACNGINTCKTYSIDLVTAHKVDGRLHFSKSHTNCPAFLVGADPFTSLLLYLEIISLLTTPQLSLS